MARISDRKTASHFFGNALIAFAVFVVALIAYAPSTLVGALIKSRAPGLSFSHSEGSLWRGQINNLSLNGISFGQATYGLSPLWLLTGRLRMEVDFTRGALTGGAIITLGRQSVQIREGRFRLALAALGHKRVLGAATTGSAEINIAALHITRAGCRTIEARVSTDFLTGPARQWGAQGFSLEGPVSCEGDGVAVTMTGAGEEGSAHVRFLLRPDMGYAMTAVAVPARREVADALAFLGFEPGEGGLNYAATGVLQEPGL